MMEFWVLSISDARAVRSKLVQIGQHWQTAYYFGYQTKRLKILRAKCKQIAGVHLLLVLECPITPTCVLGRLAMRRSIPSNAPPQINRILRVFTGIIFWSGMFAATLGSTSTTEPSSTVGRPLLHTLTAHIACDGRVVTHLTGYFVNLIQKYDARSRLPAIVVGFRRSRRVKILSLSLPLPPPSVPVASTMVNGTQAF